MSIESRAARQREEQKARDDVYALVVKRAREREIPIQSEHGGVHPGFVLKHTCLEVNAAYAHGLGSRMAAVRVQISARSYQLNGGTRTRTYQKVGEKNVDKILDALVALEEELAAAEVRVAKANRDRKANRKLAEETLSDLGYDPEAAAYPGDQQVRALDESLRGLTILATEAGFTVRVELRLDVPASEADLRRTLAEVCPGLARINGAQS